MVFVTRWQSPFLFFFTHALAMIYCRLEPFAVALRQLSRRHFILHIPYQMKHFSPLAIRHIYHCRFACCFIAARLPMITPRLAAFEGEGGYMMALHFLITPFHTSACLFILSFFLLFCFVIALPSCHCLTASLSHYYVLQNRPLTGSVSRRRHIRH